MSQALRIDYVVVQGREYSSFPRALLILLQTTLPGWSSKSFRCRVGWYGTSMHPPFYERSRTSLSSCWCVQSLIPPSFPGHVRWFRCLFAFLGLETSPSNAFRTPSDWTPLCPYGSRPRYPSNVSGSNRGHGLARLGRWMPSQRSRGAEPLPRLPYTGEGRTGANHNGHPGRRQGEGETLVPPRMAGKTPSIPWK